jgi:hypothetical protein
MGVRMIRKVSEKNFGLFILGESLIAISLGSIYWIKLVRYNDFVFISAILLSTYYINTTFLFRRRGQEVTPSIQILGFVGGFLLLLTFGVQAPQLPLKNIILIAGLILVIPALKDLISNED